MSNLPTLGGSSASGSGSVSPTASNSGSASITGSSGSGSASASPSASGSDSASSSSDTISNTITDAPSLTTSDVPFVGLTNLPTLSGYFSYPPPSVPPTADAPYMQKLNVPENFVFIVVGACIAFVALLIISWRILTSWSMNRRFRRNAGYGASYTPLTDFKQKPTTNASSNEMKDLQALPKSFSSVPSLFFSPTAEVARNSMARPLSQHQPLSSGHLPSGHYRDGSDGARR